MMYSSRTDRIGQVISGVTGSGQRRSGEEEGRERKKLDTHSRGMTEDGFTSWPLSLSSGWIDDDMYWLLLIP